MKKTVHAYVICHQGWLSTLGNAQKLVQVSKSGMEKFLEGLLCESSILYFIQGDQREQWSLETVEHMSGGVLGAEHRTDETVDKR